MSAADYNKMLEIKRKNEIKKLPLLYLLFCLLLKINPLPAKMDFKEVRVPLTKEMRIELKYMNELSRQAVLLNENKIGSLDDLNAEIQSCYKIEKRTILWEQEYNKAMNKDKELQKQKELEQGKKKTRKYLR